MQSKGLYAFLAATTLMMNFNISLRLVSAPLVTTICFILSGMADLSLYLIPSPNFGRSNLFPSALKPKGTMKY